MTSVLPGASLDTILRLPFLRGSSAPSLPWRKDAVIIDAPPLECHILDTGYCLASEHHLICGGRHRTVHCHSIVALLRHPRHGWLLWDAGYAPRILKAT